MDQLQYRISQRAAFLDAKLWKDGIIEPADTHDVLGLCLSLAAQRPPVTGPLPCLPDVAPMNLCQPQQRALP